MLLNKEKWVELDKNEFLEYLRTFERMEKITWAKNILKTESQVLGMRTQDIVFITNEIMKGNYLSFLNLGIRDYYETIAIYGMIISKTKSFEEFTLYLNTYLNYMNCWAHCDLLQFPYLFEKRDKYLELSKLYLTDQRVMVRRLSLYILFHYVKENDYLSYIFDSLLFLKDENEYYVIMMAGWLLSECIIINEKDTINFITNNCLNKKIQNKAIQKCRESNRLTQDKKDFLLQYKVK